jgi:hypothetical protein
MNHKRTLKQRGQAMITAIIMMGLLAAIVTSLMVHVHNQRERTIMSARSMTRNSCASSGLQYARTYFSAQFSQWNTYLAAPSVYNPVRSPWNATPTDPKTTIAQHTALQSDIDGDGKADVFIYIRDNSDEILPSDENWANDNDQIVYVGAVCISSTMVPRRQDGKTDPNLVTMEALLSYNLPNNGYSSQGGGGTSGTGNIN